jgi:cysteine-rich repeat protein
MIIKYLSLILTATSNILIMKKFYTISFFLLFMVSAFGQNDFLNGLKNKNLSSSKTVLVFYKPDCPYCIQMETLITNDVWFQKKIIENYNIQLIDISINEGKQIAQKYNITGVPSLLKLNSNSIEIETLKGFGSISRASKFLNIEYSKLINAKNTLFTCGNGIIENGEQCDDANTSNSDACTNTCLFAQCGDGYIQAGVEQCDDANTSNSDACTNTCRSALCGDGFIQNGVEQCDDANTSNGDGCSANCLFEGLAICGNGIIENGEQCDDANTLNSDACTNTCLFAQCGDGFIQAGVEQCDDANTSNSDACTNTCLFAQCGDGFIQAGVEQCDDANTLNSDACTNICRSAQCGDGFIQAGVEQCDDANTTSGDGCSANCLFEGLAICGNGIIENGEQCDDNNLINGDGCDSNCTITSCGNGIVTGTEQCDDSNTSNGDGCESDCTLTLGVNLNEEAFFNKLIISPNPFNNQINVSLNLKEISELEITLFDILGHQILSAKKNQTNPNFKDTSINLNTNLNSGNYFIEIKISNSNGTFIKTKKIIKQ